MNKDILYDSLDELKDYLEVLYQINGIDAVREWVIIHFEKGTTLTFKIGPSGKLDETIQICDRRLELLDKNGIKVINMNFLAPISELLDSSICTIYFSQRFLFIEEPFGLIIYKKVQ